MAKPNIYVIHTSKTKSGYGVNFLPLTTEIYNMLKGSPVEFALKNNANSYGIVPYAKDDAEELEPVVRGVGVQYNYDYDDPVYRYIADSPYNSVIAAFMDMVVEASNNKNKGLERDLISVMKTIHNIRMDPDLENMAILYVEYDEDGNIINRIPKEEAISKMRKPDDYIDKQ